MAQNFYKTAANRLAPAYNAQVKAAKSEIPAIIRLYEALTQNLVGQNAVAQQNNLESASSRGVLNSTIPVDAQVGLEQALINQQAQLGAEQAKEISGVNQKIAGFGVDRANAINSLAQALFGNNMQMKQFKLDKKYQKLNLGLQKQLGNQQYKLDLNRAKQGI